MNNDRTVSFSRRGFRLFTHYLRGDFRRNFTGVRSSGALPVDAPTADAPSANAPTMGVGPGDLPIVVYANHPSWWDPIHFALLAASYLPDRAMFGPMDARALERYRFMKRLGVFPVSPDRKGAAMFLRTALDVLERPRSSLWLTAEGTFTDPRQRPIHLMPGLAHLVRRLGDAWVVPLALEYPMWNERRPEALSRFGQPFRLCEEPDRSVAAWQAVLGSRLETTLEALAVDAQRREPSRFETLVEGRRGINRVYDAWRRVGAWIRGERFVPGHEQPAAVSAERARHRDVGPWG